ncbi:undecaprenyl-diphosphate phosphatase [Dongia sp. agr-C8]
MAILRSVSEVLPIDPEAHVVLLARLFCWTAVDHMTAAAGFIGLLLALLVYLWRDVLQMARSLLRILRGKRDPGGALLLYLLVASLPAFVITFGLRGFLDVTIREPIYIAVLLVAFGVVLYVADQAGLTVRRLHQMNLVQALIIGVFQGLAVLPGVSRIGIVITVARSLGYERPDAARFALLLSIPWMLASALYSFWLGIAARQMVDDERALITATISGIVGFLAIAFLMYWVRRGSFTPFALYRVALGGALIYALYRMPELVCS